MVKSTENNVIIGANSRIGQATALRFGRRPGNLVLASRDIARLQAWVDCHQKELSASLVPLGLDVRKTDQVDSFFAAIEGRFGSVNYLFNNAGILRRKALDKHSEEDWTEVMNTNAIGLWRCLKRAVRLIPPGGSIVNMASVSGLSGTDWGLSAYVASKFAVVGLTKVAALEFAPLGIRVNAVCPGIVRTDLTEELLQNDHAQFFSKLHPLGRTCEPDEVAAAVEWLCSSESSFISGTALPIDGGLMARVM